MNSIFKIKANEINETFISKLKENFKDKEIIITEVGNVGDLKNSIENIEIGKDLKSFTMEEFEEYSNELVRDKNDRKDNV